MPFLFHFLLCFLFDFGLKKKSLGVGGRGFVSVSLLRVKLIRKRIKFSYLVCQLMDSVVLSPRSYQEKLSY